MRIHSAIRQTNILILVFSFVFHLGCSVDSAKTHYMLAEKLWNDRKYGAAVGEFEKVTSKDPKGKLGLQALFRAASTQYLFLAQYGEAIRKFRTFVQMSSDASQVWEAQLQIGEILFFKTEQYEQAIQHYTVLLDENKTRQEAPEFLFRIAKSHFFLMQFNESLVAYEELINKYPASALVEKAFYEIGATQFTRGTGTPSGSFEEAKLAFERFIRRYPKSPLVADAKFGIASCLEEMDQLDEAYKGFEAIQKTYPSPSVIDVKLSRIRQRIFLRKTSR
jgi:TolA-binding protein